MRNPQLKILFAVIAAIAIIGFGYLFSMQSGKSELTDSMDNTGISLSSTTTVSFSGDDIDGDGLLDWEEQLWKTDPQIADTDGDGTSDGEEVKVNRDPLIKSPDDVLFTAKATEEKKLSATEKLSQDIFNAYIQLKQQELTGVEATSLEELLRNNEMTIKSTQYKAGDLNTITDSNTSINEYANTLLFTLAKYISPDQQNELEILQMYDPETEDDSVIEPLKKRADNYRSAALELSKIPVPQSAVTLHIDFINTISFLSEITDAMSLSRSDPVRSLNALSEYQYAGLTFDKQFQNLYSYFQKHSVDFTLPR